MREQSQKTDDDQIDRHDVIEQAGNDKNQNACEQGNDGSGGETDIHFDFRVGLQRWMNRNGVMCIRKKIRKWKDAGQVFPQHVVVIRAHRLPGGLRAPLRVEDFSGNACGSKRAARCAGRGCRYFAGDFPGVPSVFAEGFAGANDGVCTDAGAGTAASVAAITATIPNALNNPTHFIEHLAAKRRVMYLAPINILSGKKFAGIVAGRVPLWDIAYVNQGRRAVARSDSAQSDGVLTGARL